MFNRLIIKKRVINEKFYLFYFVLNNIMFFLLALNAIKRKLKT